MSLLFCGDCLEELKTIEDNSVDLIFCDLPYGQTACEWDVKINLEELWNQFLRVKKINTPLFFTTTTKFGVDLIHSAPKRCPFRYDLVWAKSAPAGFLSARKMPMRKHEMIYVFYEKLPFYDLSSHKHKFIKQRDAKQKNGEVYGGGPAGAGGKVVEGKYDPPLPTSVVKEKGCYGEKVPNSEAKYGQKCAQQYDPPLPTSVVKENIIKDTKFGTNTYNTEKRKKPIIRQSSEAQYNPPLPTSVVKQSIYEKEQPNQLQFEKDRGYKSGQQIYDPPLPVSVVKEDAEKQCKNYAAKRITYVDEDGNKIKEGQSGKDQTKYDPPLPTSVMEIKTTRGKHSTEKPVALMEWVLKYFSKEGDVVLDPTMGSGSTGVACRNMGRNFIGIEKDPEFFQTAVDRIEI